MAYYTAVLLAAFVLTCQGTNTTWNWTSVNHPASASSTHGALGDYVAAGLDMSRETSSTITSNTTLEATVMPISGDLLQSSVSARLSQGQANDTTSLTTTTSIAGGSGNVSVTADMNHAISATDCWQSWLEYWSTSAINQITSTDGAIPGPSTMTWTITRAAGTSWTTTTWQSSVYTRTASTFATVYSDGYPVSVSASYETFTSSITGWVVATLWSSLSEYVTTQTKTETWSSYYAITRSATALPTPSCELPSAMPECSVQWSSYIQANTNIFGQPYYAIVGPINSSSGTWPGAPYCTQAQITGDLCTSMRSYYLAPMTAWGHAKDIGWETANGTSYFPASKLLAPGCSLGCQACSITGNSVQLYYWAPSTATLVENGTETAFLTPFSQHNSGVRTVSIDGTILTSPTVYISYDTLYAANSCGAIGKTYKNTILPLQNTNHLFSLESIVPFRGLSSGYRTSSFNLADLIEPVADSVYDKQSRCRTSSNVWRIFSADKGGTFSCARTAPYAPIIGVPPEVRALDPAWEPCGAWYGGLFDPPKALQPADAVVVPTLTPATTANSPAATPKSTVDSGLPAKTSAPAVTSKPTPQADQSGHATDLTPATPKSNAEEATGVSSDGSGIGTKVSPSNSKDDPAIRPDTTRPGAGSADEVEEPVATRPRADTQLDSSEGVAAILSMFLTKGSQDTGSQHSDANITPEITPASDPELPDGQGVVQSIGSEGHTALANQGTTNHLASEQTTEPPISMAANIIVAGKTMALFKDGGDVIVGSTTLTLGQVATLAGTQISVASEGLVVGTSTASLYETPGLTAGFDDGVVAIGGIVSQKPGQSLSRGGLVATIDSEVVTHGSHSISTIRTVESVTINGEAYPASPLPDQPGAVLLAGYTLSQGGPAATINAQVVTYGSHGVSVVASTQSDTPPPTHSVVTIDGTAYTATPVQGRSGVVVLYGQTLSVGGPDVNIAGHSVTAGPNGISLVDSAVTASESAESPWPTAATEVAASYTLSVQQSSATPDEESSGSSKVTHGIALSTLTVAMIVLMLVKL